METRTIIHIIIFLIIAIIYACKRLIDFDKIYIDDNPIFVDHTVFKKSFDWMLLFYFLVVGYIIYFLLYSLKVFIEG
jgi:hypothetical protein